MSAWLGAGLVAVWAALAVWMPVQLVRRRRRAAAERAAYFAHRAERELWLRVLQDTVFSRVRYHGGQLQFEFLSPPDVRAVVTLAEWPLVVSAGTSRRFGDPGYRAALAALSGRPVRYAGLTREHEITLDLDRGSLVILPTSP